MERDERTAVSRAAFGALIVGIALSLMTFGISPAEAADPRADPRAATPHPRAEAPHGSPARPLGRAVDWQWHYGRWQIRFNWAETRQMSRGLSYCSVIAALVQHWTARIVAGVCGLLWIFADNAVNQRKCVEVYVYITPTNPLGFGRWSCPT